MISKNRPSGQAYALYCHRIALGPRAGQKVLSLRTVPGRDKLATAGLCADAHGFSLHTGVRCGEHQRKRLERLCRYITRPAIANERQLWRNATVWYGSEAVNLPHDRNRQEEVIPSTSKITGLRGISRKSGEMMG